ncbi:Y381-like protein [Mya arenaria]|uniref:Y381-like protein n=1 Tax=Mya arenaria TaxID=6604 RepID=A0ABY7FNS2_MYAAR|nr:Y381-like protein [Mya arenaria]
MLRTVMSGSRRKDKLKKIDEREEISFKYNGPFPLHDAATNGDLEAICILAERKHVDSYNEAGAFPMHLAAEGGDVKTVKLLLAVGALHICKDLDNQDPLHYAARSDQSATIEALHGRGSSLEVRDKNGATPLHVAATHGTLGAIRKLVELGADLNSRDKAFECPLHLAARLDLWQSAQQLFKSGADIAIEWKKGLQSIHIAAINNSCQLLSLLALAKCDLNVRDKHKSTAIHQAVLHNRPEALAKLVKLGADVNAPGKKGQTVVHICSSEHNLEGLKQLKHVGADLSARNKYGFTALHEAVVAGDLEGIEILHNVGVDLDFPTKNFPREDDSPPVWRGQWPPRDLDLSDFWKVKLGLRPVHLAFLHGHTDILTHLVTCGADVNAADDDGESVFHLAVFYNLLNTVTSLVTLGADRNCRDKGGRTPLHYAAHTGNLDAIRLLLKYGASITEEDNTGNTVVHSAAGSGQLEVIAKLASLECSMDAQNTNDNLASTYRLTPDQKRAVSRLVKHHNDDQSSRHLSGDIYELRVYCMDSPCRLTLEVPLDGYPGRFEGYFRCADGTQFPEVTTSEENGIPLFVGSMPVKRGCTRKFAVIVRPRVYSHTVGEAGSTLMAEADRRIRLEVPQHALSGPTTLNLQVLKTSEMERSPYKLFAADLINVTLTRNLQGQVRVQLPLHVHTDNPDDVTVFCIPKEGDIEQDHQWLTVQSPLRIANGCLMFNMKNEII